MDGDTKPRTHLRLMIPCTPFLPARVQAALKFLALPFLFAAILGFTTACSAERESTATAVPPAPAPTSAPITPTSALTLTPTAVPPTSTPEPTVTPEPTPRPVGPLVSLPEDEAPHETPIEWWYFNGFLWDEDGGEYSFHFVTFQSPTIAVGTPHLLHATLGIHEKGQHYAGERPTIATLDPDAPSVDIDADGWVMRGDGEGYVLRFDLEGYSVELSAVSTRDVVLHDSTGLVDLGEAGETYYYSRTRMQLDGWIEDGDGRRAVNGSGWMDHQWGDISRLDIGWDWVNLQLDDGADLMVAVVWQPVEDTTACADRPCPVVGERVAAYATYVAPDGSVTHVPSAGVEMTATGAWASPETGIAYPMGWQLEIAPLDIDLALAPVLPNAEFDAGVILPVVYWEGAVTATGYVGKPQVMGRGFVELVGYDPGQSTAPIPMPSE